MDELNKAITSGHIRFSPSILKRLGEELNPNVDQGLLELVKNSYDADATECHIWLGTPGDSRTVVVEDNGAGMDGDGIVSGWLVLGSSSKRTNAKTPLGRTPAGNKGLGRLAALRLGHRAMMVSRPSDGQQFTVKLDWDRFDTAETVDEIEVQVEHGRATSSGTGTRIELSQLRSPIGRVDVRRLARALVLLADPFGDEPSSFTPHLHSVEYADLSKQVQERYFDQADYRLVATLRRGNASARVTDWRGNTLWEGTHVDLAPSKTPTLYDAPDAEFSFHVFILSAETFSTRPVQLSAVREWLSQFGGVHVYVNGLRVAPYGNPGNDWLDLNLARARSPEDRPSTNTAIGRLRVIDPDDVLAQKTDRSGFIETETFAELRRFATDSLEWMARRRRAESERKRQQARQKTKSDSSKTSLAVREQIKSISDQNSRQEVQQAFDRYDRAREQENETLRREVQLYRTLSTAGITAATFAHESTGNPLKRISIITNTLKQSLPLDLPEIFEKKYKPILENVSGAVASLSVLSSATMQLVNQDKRRLGKVELNAVTQEVANIFAPFLLGRNVKLTLQLSETGEPFLRGSEAAVESILTNLINNSLAAFEQLDLVQRELSISTEIHQDCWQLTVADNGPGIEGISLEDIWLPGQTQRPGGTGLGLTIVRDTVADLGGKAEASAHGQLGGAAFTIRLPILGLDHDKRH